MAVGNALTHKCICPHYVLLPHTILFFEEKKAFCCNIFVCWHTCLIALNSLVSCLSCLSRRTKEGQCVAYRSVYWFTSGRHSHLTHLTESPPIGRSLSRTHQSFGIITTSQTTASRQLTQASVNIICRGAQEKKQLISLEDETKFNLVFCLGR